MSIFVAFEILGTIAFAISGAVVAISKKMERKMKSQPW